MVSRQIGLLMRRELDASLRARWFYVYSAAFLVGGLLLATFGLQNTLVYGYRGFAKAFAGLVHLALLFVPVLALLLSLTIGFGGAGALAVVRGVPVSLILALYGFVLLLALCFISLGLCFSVAAATRARALTFGFITWLLLVALGTLGIIVAFIRWGLPEQILSVWTVVNPVEAFRVAVISILDADLSLLGPAGGQVVARFGRAGTMALMVVSLATWSIVPGWLGLWLFRRRG
jgi:Cu-processing system permease protein